MKNLGGPREILLHNLVKTMEIFWLTYVKIDFLTGRHCLGVHKVTSTPILLLLFHGDV